MNCIDHGRNSTHPMGYAVCWHDKKCARLHRVTYCIANNLTLSDIEGKVVRHTCDNGRCINPAHLIIGTRQDNHADMVERGRQVARGNHGCAVLTAEQVATIRRRYVPRHPVNGGAALAREFGIHQTHVSKLVNNKRW